MVPAVGAESSGSKHWRLVLAELNYCKRRMDMTLHWLQRIIRNPLMGSSRARRQQESSHGQLSLRLECIKCIRFEFKQAGFIV